METDTLLSKLASPRGSTELATIAIEAWLERPMTVNLERVVPTLRAGLVAWCTSPSALPVVEREVERLVAALQSEPRSLKEVTWREVRVAVKELVLRPMSPERTTVLKVIDRAPVRALIRQLVLEVVLDFTRKASAPVAGMAKGLGSLAKLAQETVKSRGGTIGSLVGAVSGEVERQVERRAAEFADAAIAGILGQLADVMSDPRRAHEAAELRAAMFDGVLELTPPQVARELVNLDVVGAAQLVRAGLAAWLATAGAEAELARVVRFVSHPLEGRSAGSVLEELGLRSVVRDGAIEALGEELRALAQSSALRAWLQE